ncbi:cell division protein [Aerococcus urinaehominis]|uniref:Cell division protein n=1 Tax=Aerococcus urinaehominis TaxID=128944 RepID=A0A0X8FJL2_9LACT|nr:cell division regulator GpsB [Aerococcus urinaehominis]AMB98507.1 cell division protein [Aerococcus urinaehominis]SDL80263.1 DivIVA domain-containing protein [Aerococcus urinaehominis]
MTKRNLTTKAILQKEFKPALRGFNTEEVDEFLDLVIRDYESYEKEIASLKNEIDRLRQRNKQKNTDDDIKIAGKPGSQPTAGTTNYDIIRRLSNLEKAVFGSHHRRNIEDDRDMETTDDTIIY